MIQIVVRDGVVAFTGQCRRCLAISAEQVSPSAALAAGGLCCRPVPLWPVRPELTMADLRRRYDC